MIREIVTGNLIEREKYIKSVMNDYPGKIIWIYTYNKQNEIKSMNFEHTEQLKSTKKIFIEASWYREGILCPYDVREKLETFLMEYEGQEGVLFVFDDVTNSIPWYVPYILENSDLLLSDIIMSVQDINTLEKCFETNYMLESLEKGRFSRLISKWNINEKFE